MADTIATLAIRTVLDGTDLIQGFKNQDQVIATFARNTKATAADLAGSFDSAKAKAGELFSNLATGNYKEALGNVKDLVKDLFASPPRIDLSKAKADVQGLASEAAKAGVDVKAALGGAKAASGGGNAASGGGGILSGIIGALGPVGLGAAAAAGAILGIGVAARSVSKDINDMAKFAQRIGTDFGGATRLKDVLETGGVEDAETVLSKFREKLGSLRADLDGPTGDSFRRLGLDPRRLLGQGTEAAFQSVILSLRGVGDSFDQADIAADVFGKRFVDLQAIVQRGAGLFAKAAEDERLFGPGQGTIDAAAHAQSQWKQVGEFFGDLWQSIGAGAKAAFSRISDVLGTVANGIVQAIQWAVDKAAHLIAGLPNIEEVPTLGAAGAGSGPASRAEIEGGRVIQQLQAQAQLERTLERTARDRGLVGVNASRQEADAVRDLIQKRNEFEHSMRSTGSSDEIVASQLRAFDTTASTIAQQRRAEEARKKREADQQSIDQTIRGSTDDREARQRAVDFGLARPGATTAEIDQVKDLVQAYMKAGDNIREIGRIRQEAFARREGAVNAQSQALEEESRARRMAAALGLGNGALQERLALERGVTEAAARRLRIDLDDKEALDLRAATRTPLEQFNQRNRELAGNQSIDSETRDRDIAARFRQLTAGLGTGPSSFGISATDSRSREGVLAADDFRIRGQLQGGSPQERAARSLEAIERQEEQRAMQDERIAEGIRNLERQGLVLRGSNLARGGAG